MTEVHVKVEAVRVEGRHRRNLGNIEALARSIERETLINAITITPDNRLLAGERRLAAYRLLGRETIEARVVDTLDDAAARLRIERDENTERQPMAPSELVALGLALEALERPRAEARRTGRPPKSHAQRDMTSSQASEPGGSTREVVAAALGISATTYERAKTVVQAANDPTISPDERRIAQEAMEDMDSTGLISPSFNRVKAGIASRTGARKTTKIESPAHQRRAITSAEAALSGICHGLAQIEELHADITSEEAAQWVDSLSESRRVIASLISRLKERINAQPA